MNASTFRGVVVGGVVIDAGGGVVRGVVIVCAVARFSKQCANNGWAWWWRGCSLVLVCACLVLPELCVGDWVL